MLWARITRGHTKKVPMGLLIPYHTVGRYVAIHDVCAAPRIPIFAAATYRAAHRACASPCEIRRALIDLFGLALLGSAQGRRDRLVVALDLVRVRLVE